MRFIIYGAGAVGSLVGGLLAESGAEVVLVARDAQAEAVNQRGLTIRSKRGDRQVTKLTAVTSPAHLTPREGDLVLLTVKSPQTAASIQTLREVFGERPAASSEPSACNEYRG